MTFDLRTMRKPFIVAEIGASHNGSLQRAGHLIDAAYAAGADAVKFQTYTPETLAVDRKIQGGPWDGRSYHDLYREAMTPWEWLPKLFGYANSLGMLAFSSPFSIDALRHLEGIECPMYKIASPEINYDELITSAAATRKPVLISTGLATNAELRRAVTLAKSAGASPLVLLHCVSAYPAVPEDYGLSTMKKMAYDFPGVYVGLSDHTIGSTVAVAAVAMGAAVIEKHITIKRSDGGPDSAFASEPHEFSQMVKECHIAASACSGEAGFEPSSMQYKRSLWVVKPIAAGEYFTRDNVAVLRPADGMHPSRLSEVLTQRAACNIPAGTPMCVGFIAADWSPEMN